MANKVDLRAVKDNKGCHVLHAAAAKGHFGVCKFLVEEMAFDVNSTSDEGECTVIFKIMLHVGKLVDYSNRDGCFSCRCDADAPGCH